MNIDYSRHYRVWHDDSPGHQDEMILHYSRLLGPYLPEGLDTPILDVGCGMGFAMLALRRLGYQHIAGLDCDASQVASATAFGLEVTQTDDSLAFLHDQAGQNGLILCLDVIEHIPVSSQLEFVHALSKALRPGGRLICTVPNANAALASRWRYIDWTHTSSFTEHSLDFLLFNGGFEDISILEAETRLPPPHPWLPIRGTLNWWLRCAMRLFHRLELIAEFGSATGKAIPLSLNLLGVATKR